MKLWQLPRLFSDGLFSPSEGKFLPWFVVARYIINVDHIFVFGRYADPGAGLVPCKNAHSSIVIHSTFYLI